jgi:hypothetical protein
MENATTTYIVLKELYGNPPPQLGAIQEILVPHLDFLTSAWISIWVVTAVIVLLRLIHEYRTHTRTGGESAD